MSFYKGLSSKNKIIIKTTVTFLLLFLSFSILDSLINTYINKSDSWLMNKICGSAIRIILGIMSICIAKKYYKLIFSFSKKSFFIGFFKYGWPILIVALILFIFEASIYASATHVYLKPEQIILRLSVCFLYTFSVGLFEEFLCRGLLLNGALRMSGTNKRKVFFAVALTSLIFGLLHLTNILSGAGILDTILQVGYTTVGGIIYSIAYIKSNNIYSLVVLHSILDFSAFSFTFLLF